MPPSPRFRVAVTHGFRAAQVGSSRPMPAQVMVLDSWNCWRLCWSVSMENDSRRHGRHKPFADCMELAERAASRLERGLPL